MNEENSKEAFELHSKIINNELVRRALLMDNMQALSKIKQGNLYRTILGDEKAPWAAYLGLTDVHYTRNEVNNYIRIYDKFINELTIDPVIVLGITRSRLFDMLPIVDSSNVYELLEMARVYTTQDWSNEMRIRRGKTSVDECPHTFEEFNICHECGFKHRK